MKKKYIPFIFLLIFNYNFSQTVKKDSLQSLLKIEYNIFGAGLNYETPIAKKTTLDSGIGLTSGYTVIDGIHYNLNIIDPSLYLKSELKYYYNFNNKIENFNKKTKKRFSKGYKGFTKNYNSGSYFALQTKYASERLFNDKNKLGKVILAEIQWGIQRKLFKNVLFNFNIGIGHANDFTSKESSFYFATGFKFSYILSRNTSHVEN